MKGRVGVIARGPPLRQQAVFHACPLDQAALRRSEPAAVSTSAVMSSIAFARLMPFVVSECQVGKARAWRSAARRSVASGRGGGGRQRGFRQRLRARAQRGDSVVGELDELGVAEDVAQHWFSALVVGVELVEGSRQPLLWVADRAPGAEVRPGVGCEVMRRARLEQVSFGGEVAVEGAAFHACPLGNGAQGRAGWPDRSMQLDGRLGDPQMRFGHLLGALLQLVLALGQVFATHHSVTNLDISLA